MYIVQALEVIAHGWHCEIRAEEFHSCWDPSSRSTANASLNAVISFEFITFLTWFDDDTGKHVYEDVSPDRDIADVDAREHDNGDVPPERDVPDDDTGVDVNREVPLESCLR